MPIGLYKDKRIAGWRENYMAKLPSGEILTVYDNVTERKQAEESLLESESRFRVIFENANDAIFIENDQDEIVSVNQRACEMMGYSQRTIIEDACNGPASAGIQAEGQCSKDRDA